MATWATVAAKEKSMHVAIKVRIHRSRAECPVCGARDARRRYGGNFYASPFVILFRKMLFLQAVFQCESCGEEFFASRFAR